MCTEAVQVISTLRWAVFTVLCIGFCLTGPISLCIDLFVFVCILCVFCFILHSCCIIVSTVGWTWWDWSLILWTYLPSVLWHCWLGHLTRKTRPRYDLYCVWWDVKHYSINQSSHNITLKHSQCALICVIMLLWTHPNFIFYHYYISACVPFIGWKLLISIHPSCKNCAPAVPKGLQYMQ